MPTTPNRLPATLRLALLLGLGHGLVLRAQAPVDRAVPKDSTPTPAAPLPPATSLTLVPGIYMSCEEVIHGRPKLGGITIVDPEATIMRSEVGYLDAKGRKKRIESMKVYAYSDGASMFIRKPNLLNPKRFDGFLRVVVYASIIVAEPARPRSTQFTSGQRYSSGPNRSGQGRPLGGQMMNMGLNMGMGMATGGWGGWGGLGSPWGGWGGSGMGMGMGVGTGGWGSPWGGPYGGWDNVPRDPGRIGSTGEVALNINPVEELYMIDSRTGEVKTLDAVYLPALLRQADPELYKEWSLDTRPNHTRAKQLEFVRKYNLRHPLPARPLTNT